MKWFAIALVALLVIALATAVAMRALSHDPAVWHVDPAQVTPRESPNDYLLAGEAAPRFAHSPAQLAADFDRIALRTPRTERLAGRPEALHTTYLQRSAVFGFPDYISVRTEPAGEGARLLVYSRSRIGHSDMGANRARIEGWLARLGPDRPK